MNGRGFFRPRLVPAPRDIQEGQEQSEAHIRADRFCETMLEHMDAAYSYARYLSRNAAAAEDIVQEAFLRALRGIDGWRGDNAKAWLIAIVRHVYIDSVRGHPDPLHGAEPVEAIDGCTAPLADVELLEEQIARQSDAAMLRRTIEALPEPFREALVLRAIEELSYKEIATITQVPVGTVMSRLARARAMLASLLLPPDAARTQARQ